MLPSPLTILAAVIVTFFVTLVAVRGPVDADYWWHLTTGRLIVQTGAVPTTDPYSFAYDGPWVAHEWLGEVIIHVLVDAGGYTVAAGAFALATAAALLLPAHALHRRGVSVPAIVPWLVIGTYTLASFATVRPQVLSWLLLALLLVLLMGISAGDRYRPWLAIPLIGVWANVHGLYVIGLGVLAVHAAFTLMGRTSLAPRRWTSVGMLAGSAAAAMMTPAGPAGLVYPLRYLRTDDWGTAFIAEWQPADLTDPRQWGLAALAGGLLLLWRTNVPGWLVTVALLGLAAAFFAVRNAPLAVILTMPMLSQSLHRWLGQRAERAPRRARQRRVLEMTLAGVVMLAIAVVLPRTSAGSVEHVFPVAALDRLEQLEPQARLLAEYDWAGYAIHRLHPNGSVFIDGRSDMYPRRVFEDYLAIRSAAPGWEQLADDYGVGAILVPAVAPVVSESSASGWCRSFVGDGTVLMLPCS